MYKHDERSISIHIIKCCYIIFTYLNFFYIFNSIKFRKSAGSFEPLNVRKTAIRNKTEDHRNLVKKG